MNAISATEVEGPVVATKSGPLRGTHTNGIAVFRGVPYAAPPVGPLRFAPPQPMPAWQNIRDAKQDGPIAPQGRSRLAHVMGDFERPQSEDCLTLTLWTPAVDSAKRPVLVWIHGGAFSSGAGSLPWYSGEQFAAEDDIVVVSINYRLALLGDLMSDAMFRIGSVRMAEWRADQGRPIYLYQFDWQSPAGFEACHCLEIPFVFDNFVHWSDAPMLKGADPEDIEGLAAAMHGARAAFARTGKPDHPRLPTWPSYNRNNRMTMRFDSVIGPVGDLAGFAWRKPWPG